MSFREKRDYIVGRMWASHILSGQPSLMEMVKVLTFFDEAERLVRLARDEWITRAVSKLGRYHIKPDCIGLDDDERRKLAEMVNEELERQGLDVRVRYSGGWWVFYRP